MPRQPRLLRSSANAEHTRRGYKGHPPPPDPVNVSTSPGRRKCALVLRVVVELYAPAPLAAVFGVPPLEERAHLAARQHDEDADVLRGRPAVLAAYLAAALREAGH